MKEWIVFIFHSFVAFFSSFPRLVNASVFSHVCVPVCLSLYVAYNITFFFFLSIAVFNANSTTTTKLAFNFTNEVLSSTVTKVKFYVYIRKIEEPPVDPKPTLILLYQPLLPKKKEKGIPKRVPRNPRLYAKKGVSLATGTGQWYDFDITSLAQKWITHPRRNLGLIVECNDFQGNPLAIIEPHDEHEEPYVSVN